MAIPVVISNNGYGLPVRQVTKNAPTMMVATNGFGLPIVLSDRGLPFIVLGLGSPLQPYYASGTVPFHVATDNVVVPGGPVSRMNNKGSLGAALDAPVTGTAIPITGNYLAATTSTGYPMTLAPINLIGKRLMWVHKPAVSTGNYRLFGRQDTFVQYVGITASGTRVNLYSTSTGSGVAVFSNTIAASTAARVFEVEVTASNISFWVDGVSQGVFANPWTVYNIDRITQGNNATQAFEGSFGDAIVVNLGQADTAAAIAAARSYLTARFPVAPVVVAPTVTTPVSVSDTTPTEGEVVDIIPGTYAGTSPITVAREVDVGSGYEPYSELIFYTDGGAGLTITLRETATNSAGSITSSASFAIQAAPEPGIWDVDMDGSEMTINSTPPAPDEPVATMDGTNMTVES